MVGGTGERSVEREKEEVAELRVKTRLPPLMATEDPETLEIALN
jgi:hypothetical protein